MKIRILTFHYANNYGALLQCYALSKVLKDFGCKVEILNILPNKSDVSLRGKIRNFIYFMRLNNFRKKYLPPQTPVFSNNREFLDNLSKDVIYIVGSDQVWNPEITKDNMEHYFFDFLPVGTKRISYAASFGIKEWSIDNKIDLIRGYLEKFNAISVREHSAVKLCNETFNIQAVQVVDPTLLLSNYDELIGEKFTQRPTMVSYRFLKDEGWFGLLRFLGKELNFKVIALNENKPHANIKSSPLTSVKDWVRSIRNSSFVITDSYHCMLFAIIFKKQFIAIPAHPKRVGRMLSILNDLGLSDRFFNSYDEVRNSERWKALINYEEVYERLNLMRTASLNFLKTNLQNEIKN